MLKSFRQGLSAPEKSNGLTAPTDINNLVLYIDAQEFDNITFASGSGDGDPIASVAGVGSTLGVIDNSNGDNFLYEATGVYGKPSFKKTVTYKSIFEDENQGSPAVYSTQVTVVYFFTGIFNGTQDTGNILTMGGDTAQKRVSVNNSTEMAYNRNETSQAVTISGIYDLSQLTMIALSYDSLSSLNIKVNNGSFQNIDPDDSYDSGSVRFGGYNAFGTSLYHEFYGGLAYDRNLDEDELNQLYDWGVARYG